MALMKKQSAVDALQEAVKGLLYISETDAPMEPFLWKEPAEPRKERVVELAGAAKGTAVEETTLASFFATVSQEDKPKFDKLAKAFKEQLTGIKVYKIGDEAEKLLYVVGKTSDGQWAGIKTTVVET
jgi:hypothetical protein